MPIVAIILFWFLNFLSSLLGIGAGERRAGFGFLKSMISKFSTKVNIYEELTEQFTTETVASNQTLTAQV